MRSGKSAVQCWAVRITRGWGASRPRARAPGRDRGQGRTVQSICWQWRDDTGQSPASQAAATIYLSTNTKLRRRGKKSCAGLILQTFWSHHQYLHRLCGHGWTCTDPMSRVPLYTIPVHRVIELQTNLREGYAKFYNHGEGPYLPCLAQCLKCENASMHFQPGEDPSSRGLLCDEIST